MKLNAALQNYQPFFIQELQKQSFQFIVQQIKKKFQLFDKNFHLSFTIQQNIIHQINTAEKFSKFIEQTKKSHINHEKLQVKCIVQIIEIDNQSQSENYYEEQQKKEQQCPNMMSLQLYNHLNLENQEQSVQEYKNFMNNQWSRGRQQLRQFYPQIYINSKQAYQNQKLKQEEELHPDDCNKNSIKKQVAQGSTYQQRSKNQSSISIDSQKTLYQGKQFENKDVEQFYQKTQNTQSQNYGNIQTQNYEFLCNQDQQKNESSLHHQVQDNQPNIQQQIEQNQEDIQEINQEIGPPDFQYRKNQLSQFIDFQQAQQQINQQQLDQFFMTIEQYQLSKVCISQFNQSMDQ